MFINLEVRDFLGVVDMSDEVSDVRKRIFRLIKNGLTLGFLLVFFNLLSPELVALINFTVGDLIQSTLILNIIILLFVVYFGYFILVDVKYFLDLSSKRFGQKDQGNLQHITYDVAVLISLVLASFLLTPVVVSIQGLGASGAKVVNIILLAVGLFMVYHIANQIYGLLKKEIEKLILETKQFRTSHHTKKAEEPIP